MLNSIRKSKFAVNIRQQLLRFPHINRRVEAYQNEQAKLRAEREAQRIERQLERHHLHWSLIMSGQTMRGVQEDHRTLADVTDAGITVSYMNGRAVGQEHAGPTFHRFDVVNWGGV